MQLLPGRDEIRSHRHRVSGLLILLFAITYIDRVCISVAGPRIQEDLHIDPARWGWVTAMFALAYIIEIFGSYDAPFVPMAGLLFLSVLLWFRIDASQELSSTTPVESAVAVV